jgi:hypothetical protein
MSLIIAQVHKNHALLVTDTRGCIDDKPVTDDLKKVYALGRGFFSSGPCVAWGDRLFDHLKAAGVTGLNEIVDATKAWAPEAMQEFELKNPEAARLVRDAETTFIVGQDEEGLYAAVLDWSGQDVQVYRSGQVIMGGPPSLADVFPQLQDDYCADLEEVITRLEEGSEGFQLMATAEILLRRAAAFLQDVHTRCGPQGAVGPSLQGVVLLQTAPGFVVPFSLPITQQSSVTSHSAPYQLLVKERFGAVTAYRAYVRAKSLRLGREQGLTGAALEARVADDLRAAVDPETGIATLPEALKYAEVPTMAAPLGSDTFGGAFQEFLNNRVEAKFIAPFVKASVNIFRYVHKSIPGLNLLNREVSEALTRGGEEAAIIHTRSAVAGSIYAFALYQSLAGNLTGRGPGDKELRSLWLKNHQPYSIKVGGKWVSYGRLDPLATPLGLIADLHTVIHEQGTESADADDMVKATVAALFYNMASKSYLSGITQFADAWASNDPHKTERLLRNFAGDLVPQAVASLNPDNVYRDVQSMADQIISRIPGWSTTLDPRFDLFGEPILKVPGLLNRNQILTVKDAGRSVEDDLLTLGRGLSPLSPKIEGGLINLQDRSTFDNGTGKSPYIRMMELIRRPANGDPSLRQAMTELVQSSTWQQASDGTSLFPGGERWIRAAALKTKYESRALRQVMDEYPTLMNAIRAVRRMRGAAITSGESGVQQVEQLFGVTPR